MLSRNVLFHRRRAGVTRKPLRTARTARLLFAALLAVALMLTLGGCGAPASQTSTPAKAPMVSAQQAYDKGNFAQARTELMSIVAADPGNVDAVRLLGLTRANLGDNAGAAEALTEAVRRDPADDETLFRLAVIERLLGRTAQAKQHLQRALDVKPDNPTYVNELARTEMALGAYAKAATLWQGLARHTSDVQNRKQLLVLQAQALQQARDYPGSLRAYRAAYKLDPKDTSIKGLIEALGKP